MDGTDAAQEVLSPRAHKNKKNLDARFGRLPSVFVKAQEGEDAIENVVAKKPEGSLPYRFLYGALLQPEDDFIIRYRKACYAACLPMGVLLLVGCLITLDTSTIPSAIVNIVGAVIGLVWIFAWCYARNKGAAPDWLTNLSLSVPLFLCVIQFFCSHHWNFQALWMAASIVVEFADASHIRLQKALCILLYTLNFYDEW